MFLLISVSGSINQSIRLDEGRKIKRSLSKSWCWLSAVVVFVLQIDHSRAENALLTSWCEARALRGS